MVDGKLDISVKTSIDPNQLTLKFKQRLNPKEKEELKNEGTHPQKATTGRTRTEIGVRSILFA
jgi:hypothetical protein